MSTDNLSYVHLSNFVVWGNLSMKIARLRTRKLGRITTSVNQKIVTIGRIIIIVVIDKWIKYLFEQAWIDSIQYNNSMDFLRRGQ